MGNLIKKFIAVAGISAIAIFGIFGISKMVTKGKED